jgi:uncharacterized membrane protein
MLNINKFNEWLAAKITNMVSTMWCAYAFAIIALISLPSAIHGGIATLVAWTAQTFLQLVLLSIIMVGQDVLSKKSELRAQQDHETILKEFTEIKEMHAELHSLVKGKE